MSDPVIRIATSGDDVLKAQVVRGIVFVEEQDCAWEEEIDAHEATAIHVLAEADGQPVGAARLRLLDGGWAKLERIAVRRAWRGRGLGRGLTRFLIEEAARRGASRLRLHAQAHLEDFYRAFGFAREGGVFDEAGIPHVLMVRDRE